MRRSSNGHRRGRGRRSLVRSRSATNRSSSTVENFGKNLSIGIPDDLFPYIIKSLPLESLCRFKCLSKSWLSLIITNFNQSRRNPFVLSFLHNSRLYLYTISISIDDDNNSTGTATAKRLFTSTYLCPNPTFPVEANGLFCFTDKNSKTQGLFNPITKQKISLPLPLSGEKIPTFAFGYHPSSREYKVLAWNSIVIGFSDFQIFTLGTTSWRRVTSQPIRGVCRRVTPCFCLQGTIYWYTAFDNDIISFDLSNEEFGAIKGPTTSDTFPFYLFELDQCLCSAHVQRGSCNLELWILKENTRWVMIASIVKPWTSKNLLWSPRPCFTRTGEMVLTVDSYFETLYLYNFITHQYLVVPITRLPSYNGLLTNYTQNLMSFEDFPSIIRE